jgi:hypothetical protein
LQTELDIFLLKKAVSQLPGREGDIALSFIANRMTFPNEVNTKEQKKFK